MVIQPEGIPDELKQFVQWVCWKYVERDGKPTKVPFNPLTGRLADPTDPQTWVTFDAAYCHAQHYNGIGFVLSSNDPYVFVDLDDPKGDNELYQKQLRIFERFDSYTELSPSGNGAHILCKGSTPTGRKRGKFEIYSTARFMTVTGNVIHNRPIMERPNEALALWEHLGGPASIVGAKDLDAPQEHNDDDIIAMALNATNGDKFQTLLSGAWQNLYGSQSEADFAFIDIISFYTQNRAQIARIFRASPLGERTKANRDDYVGGMITRSFDMQLPPVDIEELKIKVDEALMAKPAASPAQDDGAEATAAELANYRPDPIYMFPPGLVGEIAQFILDSSPRPVAEVALSAAIALMAGFAGKSYNVSNTGLNQYVLLLGQTGIGKEAGPAGISKLISALQRLVPACLNFVGPGQIASPQALIKYLSKTSSCFVSVVGEFGLQMRQMATDNANPNAMGLRRLLLDLYNKSGQKDVLNSMIYSNRDNNTDIVQSPAFSLYGESTPSTFYGGMDESSIEDGLLPRFTLIEYNGPRLPRREVPTNEPSSALIERLASLATHCCAMQQNGVANPVEIDAEAKDFLDGYDRLCDQQINNSKQEASRQLWNRAHLRALRLAATVAVGINPFSPVIDINCSRWAERIVTAGIQRMLARFESGNVGETIGASSPFGSVGLEGEQQEKIIELIKEYFNYTQDELNKYSIPLPLFADRIIPYAYFQRRVTNISAFKRDRNGATIALKRAVQNLIESDLIREIGRVELQAKYQTRQRGFMVATAAILTPRR